MRAARKQGHALVLTAVTAGATFGVARAHADPAGSVPPTFAYVEPADPDYLRALLEMSGVIAVGFLWYLTQTDIAQNYDVNYSWPVFRRKLSGEAIGFDSNHFGTNFIGHPLGGTGYYLAGRSNRLAIPAAFGLATGGSLFWEYFGEVTERVSLNDMIVTPLAGIAIGEPLFQLGAFFDRSSATTRNAVLSAVFAPLKSLNDAFDGLEPARAARLDRYGFPSDEWHALGFDLGAATSIADAPDPKGPAFVSHELRLGLYSRLARLPDYDGPGRHALVFDDGNVSSIGLRAAFGAEGLVDFEFATDVVLVGYYRRHAEGLPGSGVWGSGTLVGLAAGYEYSLHDYDRDRPRPIDRVSTVPLGIVFEQRTNFGSGRLLVQASVRACFGGISPYALSAHRLRGGESQLSTVIDRRQYYFGLGACALGLLGVAAGPVEALASIDFERYEEVGSSLPASDERTRVAARAGSAIASTPIRLTAFVERRARAGRIGRARDERGESNVGLEIGARF